MFGGGGVVTSNVSKFYPKQSRNGLLRCILVPNNGHQSPCKISAQSVEKWSKKRPSIPIIPSRGALLNFWTKTSVWLCVTSQRGKFQSNWSRDNHVAIKNCLGTPKCPQGGSPICLAQRISCTHTTTPVSLA